VDGVAPSKQLAFPIVGRPTFFTSARCA